MSAASWPPARGSQLVVGMVCSCGICSLCHGTGDYFKFHKRCRICGWEWKRMRTHTDKALSWRRALVWCADHLLVHWGGTAWEDLKVLTDYLSGHSGKSASLGTTLLSRISYLEPIIWTLASYDRWTIHIDNGSSTQWVLDFICPDTGSGKASHTW